MTGLSDSFHRPIDYLRISVTDRCNLRCFYCMPEKGVPLLPRENVLSYEEIARVAAAAVGLGISKLRLTGGEPLVRAGLVDLVSMLAAIPGLDDLSLTTNGLLLAGLASDLKKAGLRRVNVSLDTFNPERFRRITGGDGPEAVLKGIEAAGEVGLDPVKVNTVVMPGVNDDELLAFGQRSVKGWHVRFIEIMPFGQALGLPALPAPRIASRLEEAFGPLSPALSRGCGPARYFRLPGSRGTIGFISPVSQHFCFACNRLRLTAEGRLRPCLLNDTEVNLRSPLSAGASAEELKGLIRQVVASKPLKHRLEENRPLDLKRMSRLGG
ncbi:MAG: GTP 3',8-cyclase MoaA [Chloroflexi bacterium]|nr:GTP 3',8-cyclase MoaA [Chloroflexota bacterium]